MKNEISHLVPAIAPDNPAHDQSPERKEHSRMYWDVRNGQPTGRSGTCGICNRRRKLFRFNSYYYRCSECLPLGPEEAKETAATVGRKTRRLRAQKSRLAYPCVGGPLDGEYATTEDFTQGGMYAHFASEYSEFNAASGGRKRIGGSPTMVFIHTSKLLPLKAPRER